MRIRTMKRTAVMLCLLMVFSVFAIAQKVSRGLVHGITPTCQEVIDVTSTRPLSKDFDVKRFGLNTTSRIKAFVFRFVSIPAKRIRTSNVNTIIHSSFFIYSIIWGKDSENLRTSQI